jgi:hypothetical protein
MPYELTDIVILYMLKIRYSRRSFRITCSARGSTLTGFPPPCQDDNAGGPENRVAAESQPSYGESYF